MTETIQRESIISFPMLGNFSINPPASFSLFGKTVYFYGVTIAFAFMAGLYYCVRNAKKVKLTEDDVYDAFLWLLPAAIVGARVYYVLFRLDYYLKYPREIIAVWEGGLAIYGGVIAGFTVILLVCRKKKIESGAMLDLFITACILGQAIGRWGNFFNREAFGAETEVFCRMGLTSPDGSTIFVHPTFLYESLLDLTGFFMLNRLIRTGRRKYNGQCLEIYMLWYGSGRFIIEGLRADSLYIGSTGIRVSQILSALLAAAGAVLLLHGEKATASGESDD